MPRGVTNLALKPGKQKKYKNNVGLPLAPGLALAARWLAASLLVL